jgi:hypothetical protein
MTNLKLPALAVLATLAVLLSPAPASAADGTPALFAFSAYWDGFVEFWGGMLKKQNGIVMFALGVGAVSLFIITRGKWQK